MNERLSKFSDSLELNYKLLPFKFERLNENKEIIVNEVGDYLLVSRGTTEKIIKRKLDPNTDRNLYMDLISNFFISSKSIDPLIDVLATRYRTKKSFLNDFTGLHIFVMTLRCNHSCQYCQVSKVSQDNTEFDMSENNIDNGIDYMFKSPNPHLTMEFQGGEPLLVFPKIKYAVDQVEKRVGKDNRRITFVICTNLTLVTEEMLNYCKIKNILLSTSLDGPEFIHNQNRKMIYSNSYYESIKGIKFAKDVLGEDRVSALLTISPYSIKYPIEIVDEYFNQGFRDIFLRPISPYGYAIKNFSNNKFNVYDYLKFFKTALDRILEYNRAGHTFIENYTKILLEKILTPFPVGYVDLLSPAGLINNVIVFNYDGKVYPSDESRMLAEMGDHKFLLGDLNKNNYQEICSGDVAQNIAQNWSLESLAGCSECAFQSYCGADPVRYYATQNDIYGFRPSSFHCVKNKEIIKYLIQLMDNDKEIEDIFYRWVN